MTILMSGISPYAMALLFNKMLGWSFHASILFAALVVLLYVFWGGLSSSIYNEVIQFFLIWLGLLPIVFLGLKQVGGFAGLAAKLKDPMLHAVKYLGTSNNPLGVDWFGVAMGLGFVLAFGYWTTDFLVVQRALASKNLNSARMTPIIAAFPKMLVPIIVVIPGLVALLVLPEFSPAALPTADYNSALILLMKHYLPNGLLGLAITALLASFMSGMAGNVTAFNTIWTYDIYGSYISKGRPDAHYVKVGKWTTVIGVLASVGTAYIALGFKNLMDYMQLIFSFFNAPLFATFLLGMFWKGATPWGGFWGLLVGILTAAGHYILYKLGVLSYHSEMAANFYQAIWAWSADFVVTIGVSLFTAKRDPKELVGLVFGLTPKPKADARWYARPAVWGTLAVGLSVLLYILFW
jgi:SSS family solute:Na+ symporter